MEKDKDIEKLFKDFHPEDEKRNYVRELEGKMQVVDMIRGEHEHIVKFHRMMSAISLVLGFGIGIGLMSITLLHPIEWQHIPNFIGLQLHATLIGFLVRYEDILLYLLATLSMMLGCLPLLRSPYPLLITPQRG